MEHGSLGLSVNILQITSDWKWTGPAEPMLLVLEALRLRGHQVSLVCPEAADAQVRAAASPWTHVKGLDR